ncbi:glycosyltransferase family 9 protein [Anaerobiospirillum thomasii]|uniref:glycosyltransferase family 9 protein n=1 Tax=Anaerobiospirillum thomasii TaxID=179995 RepID=UPI0024827EBD|nr:glycosyltransferase family 9 protein [Anaerobiospirillum thomasii]
MTLCAGAVVNDSGLMHSLAALDIPQVCIFGSTSTGYTPPLSKKAICVESDEPCHPCFKRECKLKPMPVRKI